SGPPLGSSGVGVGEGVGVGVGVAAGFGAGFFAAGACTFGCSFGVSFFAGGVCAGGVIESCAIAPLVSIMQPSATPIGRRRFIPASSLGLGLAQRAGMRLCNRCADLGECGLGAARIGPDEISDQHEIRAGRGECLG